MRNVKFAWTCKKKKKVWCEQQEISKAKWEKNCPISKLNGWWNEKKKCEVKNIHLA